MSDHLSQPASPPTAEAAPRNRLPLVLVMILLAAVVVVLVVRMSDTEEPKAVAKPKLNYRPAQMTRMDSSGFAFITYRMPDWRPDDPLDAVAEAWRGVGQRMRDLADADADADPNGRAAAIRAKLVKASLWNYEGEPEKAYALLEEARGDAAADDALAEEWLYSIIAYQGMTALRRGETENCILCRGESSCILPISAAAVHLKPTGSRLAIQHFTEYLEEFPDSLDVKWLLNLAHMTLGEHPHKVDPRWLVSLGRYNGTQHSIGKFTDIGTKVGVARFNQAGGVILDDFDNDDRLDVVFTTFDPVDVMQVLRNSGDGTFEDRTKEAGVTNQTGGGLQCVQADFDNDGFTDVFIIRGAWLKTPVRPTLLKNNGKGGFIDVTREAGLMHPMNSIAAAWGDFDNDGWLDLFVCNETGPSRLYRNTGRGAFVDVAREAGVVAPGTWKGATWFDYDRDGWPDLFVNNLGGMPKLYRNLKNGTFEDATSSMGVSGPPMGFSCWAFDYDNDGWEDIFSTCYDRSVKDVVRGLTGEPHKLQKSALLRNVGGTRFEDKAGEAGLDGVYATMGSNFGDLDNDGFLDIYLATGDPQISTLVPNRLLRNLDGRRFGEITGSSGTGHLQKGHGVAIGDWRRCGSVDLFVEMGGAIPGDRYHNILFRNPGQGNNWLNVKLVGTKSNCSAIGARIKVTTAGESPMTVHRWVTTGSSFGANPLEQHIGLRKATRIATLEVYWPTTGRTQTFKDLDANQYIEVTEGKAEFRKRDLKPIPVP